MARRRMFFDDMNCIDAARLRLRNTYDQFDTVVYQFSGGKDSTAILHLGREIHEERDLGPLNVVFRDEEFLSPSTVKFVEEVSEYDWVDMEWYCLPQAQEMWFVGKRMFILMWSQLRAEEGRLFRTPPAQALTAEYFGLDSNRVIPRHIDEYTMHNKKGRVAYITGVRASESMIRHRAVVQKLHENYINRPYGLPKAMPMRFSKVIYDWQSDDVYKFLEEKDAPYCEFYDLASMSGANQRVGTPLNPTASRRLMDVVRTEPEFYDRLVECFPSLDAQRRLWHELDTERMVENYAAEEWEGARRLIDENVLTNGLRRKAMGFVHKYKKKHEKDPYGYPVDHLIRTLLLSSLSYDPSPVGPRTRADTVRRQKALDDEAANSLDAQDDFKDVETEL